MSTRKISAAWPPIEERWNADVKAVIIGGVAGGVTAAARFRHLNEQAESFFFRFRVDMRIRHEVTAIHPERRAVSVKNLETGESLRNPMTS